MKLWTVVIAATMSAFLAVKVQETQRPPDLMKQAQTLADARIENFRNATNPVARRTAFLEMQADPIAVTRLNVVDASKNPIHKDLITTVKGADGAVKITVTDPRSGETRPITADEFTYRQSLAVTDPQHPDAYAGGKTGGKAVNDIAAVDPETGLRKLDPGTRLRDPTQLSQAIEFKSNEAAERAAHLEESGRWCGCAVVVGAAAGVIVWEIIPTVAICRILFTHRSPLSFRQIGLPTLPVRRALMRML